MRARENDLMWESVLELSKLDEYTEEQEELAEKLRNMFFNEGILNRLDIIPNEYKELRHNHKVFIEFFKNNKGFYAKDMAKEIGVTQQTLHKYTSGRKLPKNADKFEELYGLKIKTLNDRRERLLKTNKMELESYFEKCKIKILDLSKNADVDRILIINYLKGVSLSSEEAIFKFKKIGICLNR